MKTEKLETQCDTASPAVSSSTPVQPPPPIECSSSGRKEEEERATKPAKKLLEVRRTRRRVLAPKVKEQADSVTSEAGSAGGRQKKAAADSTIKSMQRQCGENLGSGTHPAELVVVEEVVPTTHEVTIECTTMVEQCSAEGGEKASEREGRGGRGRQGKTGERGGGGGGRRQGLTGGRGGRGGGRRQGKTGERGEGGGGRRQGITGESGGRGRQRGGGGGRGGERGRQRSRGKGGGGRGGGRGRQRARGGRGGGGGRKRQDEDSAWACSSDDDFAVSLRLEELQREAELVEFKKNLLSAIKGAVLLTCPSPTPCGSAAFPVFHENYSANWSAWSGIYQLFNVCRENCTELEIDSSALDLGLGVPQLPIPEQLLVGKTSSRARVRGRVRQMWCVGCYVRSMDAVGGKGERKQGGSGKKDAILLPNLKQTKRITEHKSDEETVKRKGEKKVKVKHGARAVRMNEGNGKPHKRLKERTEKLKRAHGRSRTVMKDVPQLSSPEGKHL